MTKDLTLQNPELKLTPKQGLFLKYYLKSGNASDAAMKAYNCKDRAVAGNIGCENLRKLQALETIKMLMEARGITAGKLMETLSNGLEAKKITGTKDEFIEVDDHPTRHRFMETAARWMGIEGKKQEVSIGQQQNQYNYFSVSKEEKEALNNNFAVFLKKFYSKQSEDAEVVG